MPQVSVMDVSAAKGPVLSKSQRARAASAAPSVSPLSVTAGTVKSPILPFCVMRW